MLSFQINANIRLKRGSQLPTGRINDWSLQYKQNTHPISCYKSNNINFFNNIILMGGCGSREKELREKVGFPQPEFDYSVKKFNKITQVKPGKSGEYFVDEGLKMLFPENTAFALKLYRFFRQQGRQNYVDIQTYLITIDLFARISMKLQNQPYRQVDLLQLFSLVSLQPNESFNPQLACKSSVSFSKAARLFKELIDMQSGKKEILCQDDDQAPLLLMNNIFQNQSQIDFTTFLNRLREELPQANKVIKDYFTGKFLNKQARVQLPSIRSSITLNRQLIGRTVSLYQALFNLSAPWFHKCINVELIYKHDADAPYNFNQLANALLQARQPTLMLFRHTQRQEPHQQFVFGFFCPAQWRISPDISGNRGSFIFSLSPRFKLYSTSHGQGQSKFAILVPIITKRSSQQISTVGGPKHPGLGIGGSGYEQHRIWLDGRQLQNSWVREEDKTFEAGQILGHDIHNLNIDLIEVWQLHLNNVGQSTSYFKSQMNNHFQDQNKRVNQNALREVLVTLNQEIGRKPKREGTQEFMLNKDSIPELPEMEENQNEK